MGIHPGDVPGRLGVDFQLILTAVAFKLVLTSMLPPVSYMTVLDMYVYAGFAFLSAVTVLHTIFPLCFVKRADASPFAEMLGIDLTREEEQAFLDADAVVLYILSSGWVAFNIGYAVYCRVVCYRNYRVFVQQSVEEHTAYNTTHDEIITSEGAAVAYSRSTNKLCDRSKTGNFH